MNLLETWIEQNCLDPDEVMNKLQGHGGWVADEAITPADVCDSDAKTAIEWLEAE